MDFDGDTLPDLYLVGGLVRGCGEGKCEFPLGAEQYGMRGAGRFLQNLGGSGLSWRDITFETQTFNISQANYETLDRLEIDYHEQGRGAAKGDFNDDGYPDFVVTTAGGFGANIPGVPPVAEEAASPAIRTAFVPGPTFMYMNPAYDNNWLKVRVEGTESNRGGIGAIVKVRLHKGKILGGSGDLVTPTGASRARGSERPQGARRGALRQRDG